MAQRLRRTSTPFGSYCDSCPLAKKRQFVGQEHPKSAELAIIGESPGRMEILDRRPFVGPSGRLVSETLEAFGLERSEIFIGNVVQCRCVGLPDTKPTHNVTELCGYITAHLMRKAGVKRVLSLGAFALNYFKGTGSGLSIMKLRGQPFTSRPFHTPQGDTFNFEVHPTFHPAAILRRPDGFTEFERDLEHFFYPEDVPAYTPGEYSTVDDLEDALCMMDEWLHADFVVLDLETSGYSPHDDYIICVAASWRAEQGVVFTHELVREFRFWKKIAELNKAGVRWVMHMAFFDHRWIYHKTKINLNIFLDTVLSNYSLDERAGVHDLKKIAAWRFGFPDWEAEISKYLRRRTIDSYADIPRNVLYEYAAFDADATWRLARDHLETMSPQQRRLVNELFVPGTVALGKMSLTGISVDSAHWQRLYSKYEQMTESAKRFMQEYVDDFDFNPNSPKQVQRWMYDVFDLPTHDKSAKIGHHPKLSSGRTSTLPPRTTAMDQLERLSDGYEQSIWIRALIVYRTKRKAITSYLKGYKPNPRTGRIHPRYLVHGTRTGRLSSRDPNIMNAPHYGYIRELIVPAEGKVLVSVDYSQAELRVLAALSESKAMAEIYQAGGDLHDIVSTEIFGKGYTKRERMIAKAIVFGIVYGRSISNIAETFGLSQEKANEYYYTFLGGFDGVKDWMERQKQFALKHGYVDLPTGNRRRFRLITQSNVAEVQRQAVNTPVQGTASNLMFMSLIELLDTIVAAGGNILFPLHDSLMFELPIDRWKELVYLIVRVMEDVPRRLFGDQLPFAADCDVGWRWGRMFEFKKKDGILTLDDEKPGWWPRHLEYPEPVPLDYFALEPEPEDWYEHLQWEETEWATTELQSL